MGFRHISRDVKVAAIRLHESDLLDLDDILDVCGFSRRTFFRILKLWRETGDVVKPDCQTRGRPRILIRDDIDYLLELVNENPGYFLDEFLDLLDTNRFISVHFTTIYRELERLGMSRKKLKKIASERNNLLRADFVGRMAAYSPEELCFLDETSKDKRTVGRRYGRSRKGRRATQEQPFVRGRRVSVTGFLTLDGIVAKTAVEGSMTRELYLQFLENTVLPQCSPYPGPRSVLVMDNARIHHGDEILELCDRFGVRIEYLPPYSPDLNPIEEAFSKIKHFLRRHGRYYLEREDYGLLYDMFEVMEIITPDDARGYFGHAGYF
ncbi:hypothetical protein NMY22_g6034 [Coprinellus aureogranulatus]|nr:hypothetical protein NMY22_g6034 [Coprinellus aureogranulatus]